MNSLILTYEGFQDQEVVYPYYRLMEEINSNENVFLFANKLGRIHGILGCHVPCNRLIDDLKTKEHCEKLLSDCQLLVIPGGVKALEKLRQEVHVIDFIKEWSRREKIIASTCHGAQLLISAKVTKGRKISGYYSIEDDIVNSGAEYSRDPVVVSDHIVSSPHYDNMGVWMKTAVELAKS